MAKRYVISNASPSAAPTAWRGGTPRTETEPARKTHGIPIGAAIVVLLGVMVLSKGR